MDCAPFKKPGPGPGFSHTAPAFLLFRKKSRLLGCLAASVLATPLRRCQPFAGYQAQPFQSKLTALPTRLFPLPRTCACIPAGLNGLSFPNKKAPGRVPYLYDPGAAGECIFVRGRFICWVGLKLCCGQEGSRSVQRLERAAGKRLHVLLILSWRSGGGNSIRDSVRSVHQAGDDLQYLGNGNGISHAFHIRG